MGEKQRQVSNHFEKKMCKFHKQSTMSSGLASSGDDDDDEDGNHLGEVADVAETAVSKKERKKCIEKEIQEDPLIVLGFDITHMILSFLDAHSVALCLVVSRGWHGVACSDRLWSTKCEELWLGKAHIPRMSRTRGLSKLHAYALSIMDGKRMRIRRDDLCDHVWEFHFKEAAPQYWRNLDPYWKGTGEHMYRYFHPDGSQTADLNDGVWGGHEACYCVVTGLEADGKIREHYVRINRWPQLYISRKQDWSWEMSNHLFHYSSIPDPEKEDGTGPFFQFCW